MGSRLDSKKAQGPGGMPFYVLGAIASISATDCWG